MKPSEKITKRKYTILQNKMSNYKVKVLTLEYELESVKKDLIREKGNYQSLKEDIKDLKFQNLEDKVFLLEKIVRLYEDKPKDTIKYIDRPTNGSVTTTSSTLTGI